MNEAPPSESSRRETLMAHVQRSLGRAEAHVGRIRRTNRRHIVLSLIANAVATLVAGLTAIEGPLAGEGLEAWKITCGGVAACTALAGILTGLHQRFGISGRLARATACAGRLSALDIALGVRGPRRHRGRAGVRGGVRLLPGVHPLTASPVRRPMRALPRPLSLALLLAACAGLHAHAQPSDADALARAKARTYPPVALDGLQDAIRHFTMRMASVDYARYRPEQVVHIAENLLLYQNADGGWPKNQDWLRVLAADEGAALQRGEGRRSSTLDNRTTYTQVAYLAEVYRLTGLDRYRTAARRGLDYLLAEQRPSGGWRGSDVEAITFNDDVMAGVLTTLQAVAAGRPPFAFVDEERRDRAAAAVARGTETVLRCQVVIDGVRTAWGQQHHHATGAPIAARTFEPASLASAESVGVVRFLMSIEEPSAEVTEAVRHAAAWLERAKVEGIRVETVEAEPVAFRYHRSETDRVVVEDASAPPIWARLYALEDGVTPIFANRDRRIVYRLAEVDRERRTGYAWYGYWPADLLARDYPAWRQARGLDGQGPR